MREKIETIWMTAVVMGLVYWAIKWSMEAISRLLPATALLLLAVPGAGQTAVMSNLRLAVDSKFILTATWDIPIEFRRGNYPRVELEQRWHNRCPEPLFRELPMRGREDRYRGVRLQILCENAYRLTVRFGNEWLYNTDDVYANHDLSHYPIPPRIPDRAGTDELVDAGVLERFTMDSIPSMVGPQIIYEKAPTLIVYPPDRHDISATTLRLSQPRPWSMADAWYLHPHYRNPVTGMAHQQATQRHTRIERGHANQNRDSYGVFYEQSNMLFSIRTYSGGKTHVSFLLTNARIHRGDDRFFIRGRFSNGRKFNLRSVANGYSNGIIFAVDRSASSRWLRTALAIGESTFNWQVWIREHQKSAHPVSDIAQSSTEFLSSVLAHISDKLPVESSPRD